MAEIELHIGSSCSVAVTQFDASAVWRLVDTQNDISRRLSVVYASNCSTSGDAPRCHRKLCFTNPISNPAAALLTTTQSVLTADGACHLICLCDICQHRRWCVHSRYLLGSVDSSACIPRVRAATFMSLSFNPRPSARLLLALLPCTVVQCVYAHLHAILRPQRHHRHLHRPPIRAHLLTRHPLHPHPLQHPHHDDLRL